MKTKTIGEEILARCGSSIMAAPYRVAQRKITSTYWGGDTITGAVLAVAVSDMFVEGYVVATADEAFFVPREQVTNLTHPSVHSDLFDTLMKFKEPHYTITHVAKRWINATLEFVDRAGTTYHLAFLKPVARTDNASSEVPADTGWYRKEFKYPGAQQ